MLCDFFVLFTPRFTTSIISSSSPSESDSKSLLGARVLGLASERALMPETTWGPVPGLTSGEDPVLVTLVLAIRTVTVLLLLLLLLPVLPVGDSPATKVCVEGDDDDDEPRDEDKSSLFPLPFL